MREMEGDHCRHEPLFLGPRIIMRVALSNQRGQRWIAEVGWMHREMEVRRGRGYNPLHTTGMVTRFPYSRSSQEKVCFVPENPDTHTHTLRDGSVTVAAGHTSGGTVGQ